MGNRVDEKAGREHAALDDEGDVSGEQTVIPDGGEYERKYAAIHGIHESHAVGSPEPNTCFFPDPD